MDTPIRPGGPLASRPLHFFWVVDCSGSMNTDGKIQSLNVAIKEALPAMQVVAGENPNAQLLVRVVKFSDSASWQVSQPTPVAQFHWQDLAADGLTFMGQALNLIAEQLKMPPMDSRALPPVIVLISDGQPTDNFSAGLQALLNQPWGKKAVRLAIAIGRDADKDCLKKFIAHPEIPVLEANSPQQLTNYIKWASTVVVSEASQPTEHGQENAATNIQNTPIPMNTPTSPSAAGNSVVVGAADEDVW